MTSSARLAGLLLLSAAQAAAQQGPPPLATGSDAPLPPLLVQRIAGAVAERWDVPAERVRLEFSMLERSALLPAQAPFRLLGRGDDGWFAIVFEPKGQSPLAAKLRAGLEDSVAIAVRPLPAGAQLAASDINYTVRTAWRGPMRTAAPLARPGDLVRRAITKDEVLAAPAVTPAPLVTAGASVQLEWRRGDVIIELQGTAVNAAAAGEPVQVRVAGRTGQLRGVAIAADRVRVGA